MTGYPDGPFPEAEAKRLVAAVLELIDSQPSAEGAAMAALIVAGAAAGRFDGLAGPSTAIEALKAMIDGLGEHLN